jgi:pimeloyl-ACP methyl ester carboxylesterase
MNLLASLLALFAVCAAAQERLHDAPAPVPASIHPPAVLLNGYQLHVPGGACPVRPSASAFGRLQELLEAEGRPVLYFDNCRECPNASIEDCARALQRFLEAQRTVTGEPVREFDLIGHSKGGLIARAYLAGMFSDGWFPPIDHRVRKLVLIATPNFGAYTITGIDTQTRQMQEGSRFLWELGTWHQGNDDFRGVDAIAILGNAHGGTGDGVVSWMSASIAFAHFNRQRTRVLEYCHTSSLALLPLCGLSRIGIAEVDSKEHLTWRILDSFLNDRNDWRFIGSDGGREPWMRTRGIGFGFVHDANDQPFVQRPVLTEPAILATRATFPFVTLAGEPFPLQAEVYSGGVYPLLFKYGPVIGRALAERRGPGLQVESGQIIEVIGQRLDDPELYANGERLEVTFTDGERIRAWLPEKFFGLVWLTVRNVHGSHTVRLMASRPDLR